MKKPFQGYIFIQRDYHGKETRFTVPTMDVNLPELLRDFSFFLKGCGFSLPDIDTPIILAKDDE